MIVASIIVGMSLTYAIVLYMHNKVSSPIIYRIIVYPLIFGIGFAHYSVVEIVKEK